MSSTSRTLGLGLLLSMGLAACGGGGSDPSLAEQPLNVDYSTLKVAQSPETPLLYANGDEQILAPPVSSLAATAHELVRDAVEKTPCG